jgi:hypothetical protein
VSPSELAKAALSSKDGPVPADDNGEADYSPAKSSMSAFIEAVKSGDVDAALDAYADVKANCGGMKE